MTLLLQSAQSSLTLEQEHFIAFLPASEAAHISCTQQAAYPPAPLSVGFYIVNLKVKLY